MIISNVESCCFPTLHNALVNGFVRAGKILWEGIGQLFFSCLKHRTYSDSLIHKTLEAAECGYICNHFLAQEVDTRLLFNVYDLNQHERNWDIIEKEDFEFASQCHRPIVQHCKIFRRQRKLDSSLIQCVTFLK